MAWTDPVPADQGDRRFGSARIADPSTQTGKIHVTAVSFAISIEHG